MFLFFLAAELTRSAHMKTKLSMTIAAIERARERARRGEERRMRGKKRRERP